jgi:hypothetical protein
VALDPRLDRQGQDERCRAERLGHRVGSAPWAWYALRRSVVHQRNAWPNVVATSQPGIIGIVGGVGPLAGLDLQAKIIAQTVAARDQDYLPVISVSWPGPIPDRTEYLLGRVADNPAHAIMAQLRLLASMGATVAAIPRPTRHLRRRSRGRGRVRAAVAPAAPDRRTAGYLANHYLRTSASSRPPARGGPPLPDDWRRAAGVVAQTRRCKRRSAASMTRHTASVGRAGHDAGAGRPGAGHCRLAGTGGRSGCVGLHGDAAGLRRGRVRGVAADRCDLGAGTGAHSGSRAAAIGSKAFGYDQTRRVEEPAAAGGQTTGKGRGRHCYLVSRSSAPPSS